MGHESRFQAGQVPEKLLYCIILFPELIGGIPKNFFYSALYGSINFLILPDRSHK